MAVDVVTSTGVCTKCQAELNRVKTDKLAGEFGPADGAHKLIQLRATNRASGLCGEGSHCIFRGAIKTWQEKDPEGFALGTRYYPPVPSAASV